MNVRAGLIAAGVAMIVCAVFLVMGLAVTMTGGNIWWAVPALAIPGAFLTGAGAE